MSAKIRKRRKQMMASTERAVFGATITLVDLESALTRTTAYTGITSLQACRRAAAECDQRGPSWRVRCVSTPDTIYTDLVGDRTEPGSRPPEATFMGLAGRLDLVERLPLEYGNRTRATHLRKRRKPRRDQGE